MRKQANVTVHKSYRIGEVDPRMYGAFLEPHRANVYGGMFNPDHETADDMGFRQDLIRLMRELGIPAVRLPGGNFVSGYDWEDSIGPREERRARLDLAWREFEPNTVGLDEYLEWARRAETEAMYTVNMGTRGINSAVRCIEYCNIPGGTYWSDLRRKNGREEPHGIKTWYLGNEMDGPWQIGAMDAKSYGRKVHEVSKAMKWVDPRIETIATGSSSPLNHTYPQWDETVLEECYESVDYLSLHYYHGTPPGAVMEFLNGSTVFEEFIQTELAACDFVQAKLHSPKKMMISFDEYGCMFSSDPPQNTTGRAGAIPYTTYNQFMPEFLDRPYLRSDPNHFNPRPPQTLLNAVSIGSLIMTFLRHADRIKIACMSGGLGNAIAYNRDTAWRSASYWPYYHLARYGRGTALHSVVDGPTFNTKGFNHNDFYQSAPYEGVQYLEVQPVWNEEREELTLFVVNRSLEDDLELKADLRSFEGYELVEHLELTHPDPQACNTVDRQDNVIPHRVEGAKLHHGDLTAVVKKLSWNVIRLRSPREH